VVGDGRPVDERFAQAGDGVDHHEIPAPGRGVCGEDHAGGACIDHPLDDHVHRDGAGAGVLANVGGGPFGSDGDRALPDGCGEVIGGIDAEHGVVLSRERVFGSVFSCGRGPDRHR
jgi:hypothetical protein